jgi:sigma-B regulation protein RsbU (phosphoserine phosphatase)
MAKALPRSRAGRCALAVAVLWGVTALSFSDRIFRIHPQGSPWGGVGRGLFALILAIPAGCLLHWLYRLVKTGFLWKIRRRLILVYVFVGAIPLVLIAGIFYVSAVLVYYQFSYYLIFKQIGIHTARVHTFGLSLREGLQQMILDEPGISPERLRKAVDSEARYILGAYPNASITLRCERLATGDAVSYVSRHSVSMPLGDYQVPAWLQSREGAATDWSGLVLEGGGDGGAAPRLLLRSFVPEAFPSDLGFSLEVTVPFDGFIMGRLKAALGQDVLLTRQSGHSGMGVVFPLTDIRWEDVLASSFELDGPDASSSGMFGAPGDSLPPQPPRVPWMWSIPLYPVSWEDGEEMSPAEADTLMVEVSFPQLLRSLRNSDSAAIHWVFLVLAVIVAVFILAEVASIVLGILLTRSVTVAVDNLDVGTQLVGRGNLGHRIVVRSQDQLGALAASFNKMTEYVQQLVRERVERERLEREIEIAREVQERLFPDRAPTVPHLEIDGLCLPARMVSGDYYDFLPLGDEDLGVAVGDISGKGISAALLMASLQATLHSNVMHLHDASVAIGDAAGERDVAGIVARVNRQLYAYTGENRFATFFYAHYDGAQGTLAYCNAGHNPPLHFHGGGCRRLEAGGTVVGIFPEAGYVQETVQLAPGDLVVAYTDGLSECANMEGEEFGEGRLIELVAAHRDLSAGELKERIIESVMAWRFGGEQTDDITLIIMRVV